MSPSIVLCRICLATDIRMFPIAGTSLELVYEKISNTIINIADSKPVTVCYICYATLNTCYKLMFRCKKAEKVMDSILEESCMVSKKAVLKLDRAANNLCTSLTTTPVEYFDTSTFVNPIMVKDEPVLINVAQVKDDFEFVNVQETMEVEPEDLGMSANSGVCRICLAVDVRMFIIAGTPLQPIFEKITNNLLHTVDSRPIAACYLCQAQLRKCHKLTLKANDADDWMSAMLKEYSELSRELVAAAYRNSAHLRSTLSSKPAECYDSLGDTPSIDVTVKIEVEPDLYVGSPDMMDPEYMNDSEAEDDPIRGTRRKMRTRSQRRAARAVQFTETPEDGTTDDPKPKPEKRKRKPRTVKPKDKSETQEKKEKPRRVYKKRIRAYIHECPVCKRMFNRTNHLKDHMKIHTDDRPFECSTCNKRFIQKVNLKNHMMTHTGEKPFECDICHTGFIAKSDFNRHMNTHKERLFACNICERRFTQNTYLKSHMSTHTSERPHECHICHRRFGQKPYLKNHLKRHADGDRLELKPSNRK